MEVSPVRELTFQIIFQMNYREIDKSQIDFLIDEKVKEEKVDKKNIIQAKQFINNLLDKIDEIDEKIKQNLDNWKFERIGFVEKTALRMGFFELLYKKNIPFKVVIDESIKLTKKYGEEKSIKFVNGILDNCAKKMN